MSDFRDEFKKITGGDCKITAIHDVENRSDFEVKMFNPRYVDWLERRLANEANKQPDTKALRLQNVMPCFYKQDYINWQNKYFKPCNRVYDFQTIGKDEFFTKEQLHKKYEKAMLESPFK